MRPLTHVALQLHPSLPSIFGVCGPSIPDILCTMGLACDRSAAKNLVKAGRVSVNMRTVDENHGPLVEEDLILGHAILRVEVPGKPARWAQLKASHTAF